MGSTFTVWLPISQEEATLSSNGHEQWQGEEEEEEAGQEQGQGQGASTRSSLSVPIDRRVQDKLRPRQ